MSKKTQQKVLLLSAKNKNMRLSCGHRLTENGKLQTGKRPGRSYLFFFFLSSLGEPVSTVWPEGCTRVKKRRINRKMWHYHYIYRLQRHKKSPWFMIVFVCKQQCNAGATFLAKCPKMPCKFLRYTYRGIIRINLHLNWPESFCLSLCSCDFHWWRKRTNEKVHKSFLCAG